MPPVDVRHVLMTADAVGGVWTFARDLARSLGARGIRVSLAVLGPSPSPTQRDEVRALGRVDLYEHPGRLEWMADPWDSVAEAGRWLLGLAHTIAPDVVHLNGLCHGDLPWPAPVLITGHSCVVSWWRAVHGTEPPPEWRPYADEVTVSLRAADLVAAPTAAMLHELATIYGPLPRTIVIANGRYHPGGTVDKEPFVLSAGRLWDEAKNVRAVCAAAPLLSWPVRVAGESRSPDGTAIPCEGVEFLGRLGSSEMAQAFARASIYVLPARYEPFGLSLVEAAQAGCALVLGDIRSLREVWGDTALFVPPDNCRMLAATVESLIRDRELRRQMASLARARAHTFSPERMAAGYIDAYAHASTSGARSAVGQAVQVQP